MPLPVAFNNLAANPMAAPYRAPYYYDNNDPATYSGQGYSAGVEWDSELPAESDFDWDSMIEDKNDIIDFDNEESRPANNVGAVRRLTQIPKVAPPKVAPPKVVPKAAPNPPSKADPKPKVAPNPEDRPLSGRGLFSEGLYKFPGFPPFTIGEKLSSRDRPYFVASRSEGELIFSYREQYDILEEDSDASIRTNIMNKLSKLLPGSTTAMYIPISTKVNQWNAAWNSATADVKLQIAEHVINAVSSRTSGGLRRLQGYPLDEEEWLI